jgi:cystathionine beta-lyase
MAYNFDKIIERKGTDALKYGVLKERYGRDDLLPLWVADMDFAAPPELVKALTDRVQHGIFGYTFASDDYYNAIINWQKNRHHFDVQKEEISFVPGVVKGIAFAIDCFTKSGDKIIIQPPVYHPFRIIPTLHHREVVNNPLVFNGTQYEINFEHLEFLAKTEDCKMLILSNPHNPGGRVWTKEELKRVAEICHKHNILVVADEIHADLALNGHTHTPYASVSELAAQNSITLLAPSKTFNIAGIVSSYSVIKNVEIRTKFHSYLTRSELEDGTIFAYLALQVAYNEGAAWLDELKTYLWNNILFVDEFLKKNIPQLKVVFPEASFLLWLDCSGLQLPQNELVNLFVNKAKLALNDGEMFGAEGIGFMRMNIGCPRATLEKALEMLKNAVFSSERKR